MEESGQEQMVCSFCQQPGSLGAQVLPNGDLVVLCQNCATAMQAAAETAQKQFDTINQAAIQREIQTRAILTSGALLLATGASIWRFHSSPSAGLAIFGACLFVWGMLQRAHG